MSFWKAEIEILGIFMLLVVTFWVLQIGSRLFNHANTIDWFTGLGVFVGMAVIWASVIRKIVEQAKKYFSKGPQE